ncbi:MAG: class II fructose-1,6-bisphosphate aldolase [Limnochordia bacterium]
MALVPASTLLQKARAGRYAVGAFNINNMEILQAIIAAAEAERAPVIVQASQGGIKYAGLGYIVAMAQEAAAKASVPVALNLDHGTSYEQVIQCIVSGFSTVMFDGSKYPLEENIALTRRVVEVAHSVGVAVEGELGKIGGTEDDIVVSEKDATFTDPAEAKEFVEKTGVDALAIAIGTAHGVYKGEPRLDFQRLEKISQAVDIPLVLHGASGLPDESVKRAVSLGIAKINIDTEIRQAFAQGVKDAIANNPDEIDPRKILAPAKERMQALVQSKMRLFGCSGQA